MWAPDPIYRGQGPTHPSAQRGFRSRRRHAPLRTGAARRAGDLDRRGLLRHGEQQPCALHDLPAGHGRGGDPPASVGAGTLMGYALARPVGGPNLGLRLDPDRARASAGFDYFAIGVPDKGAIDHLARKLDELGQPHAGVHRACLGWILPEVLDPDGHALRFYTMEHHTQLSPRGDHHPRSP